MPPFRRGPQPIEPTLDLDDLLSSYEVTRPITADPSHTGLPAPRVAVAARAAATPDAAGADTGDDHDEQRDSVADEHPDPATSVEAVALVPGESLDLEVVDLDGTAYLFRGVVLGVEDTTRVAISARSADELQGWDVLTSGAQVVAVAQRDEESWLLTTRIVGTAWAEAAAIVDLQPPRRALSTGRRVHQRVQRAYRVALPANVAGRATTIDLSPGGAAIVVTGADAPPSGTFEVIVLLPDPAQVQAVVTGSRPGPDDTQVWHLQFVVVPSLARTRLVSATA